MKKSDVKTLSKLFTLKQQAASLKYKQRLTEQQHLFEEAARCLRESYITQIDSTEAPTAGDLIAETRYRKSLRERSARLIIAAHSLDEMIAELRANTRMALTREAAMERLTVEVEKQTRAEANGRDETSREQMILIDR